MIWFVLGGALLLLLLIDLITSWDTIRDWLRSGRQQDADED